MTVPHDVTIAPSVQKTFDAMHAGFPPVAAVYDRRFFPRTT